MNGQMQQVEGYLGDLGRQCNTRLLEKKGVNLRNWEDTMGARGNEAPANSVVDTTAYRRYGRH